MENRGIKVSEEVYNKILAAKAELIEKYSRNVSMSEAIETPIDFWFKHKKVKP